MQRIGKYELIRKLGEGSTATVWLARDSFAERDVAIKLIDPKVLSNESQGRIHRRLLRNEASLAGKLVHPHIVQILDAVVAEDQSYIVMEYVGGGTLDQFCNPDNLLPLDRLVEIIFKCTRALDYAFRLGITHRDIKPANILLDSSPEDITRGDIKVSDFGAALQSTNQTQTQVSGVGSPAYMSPQQVREAELDHRTDIYSLGVVMYQLLTGRLPFQAANNFAMVYQICHVEPPPPSSFRRDVPPSLDAIVARAMHKDLDSRYATWEAFSHDLAQAFRNSYLASRKQAFPDSEKFETLRKLPFFAEFSDVEIWEVVRFSRWEEVAPGTIVMKDGEVGDFFCFLTAGELRVAKKTHTLSVLSPGDCFGEMAVIGRDDHQRGADVVVQTTARIVNISGNDLRSASDTCRMHFYEAFLEVLAGRLSQANVRLIAD
jgi:eukaryotic-like serine/threonine-protein kinase